MKKNILILRGSFHYGGAEIMILKILEHLGEKYNFLLFSLEKRTEFSASLSAQGIRIIHGNRSYWSLWNFFALCRVIRQEKIDLLYVHSPMALIWSGLLTIILKIPAIFHFHGLFGTAGNADSFWKKYLRRIFLKRHQVIAVSQSLRNHLLEQYALSPKKVEVIYNGIELDATKISQSQALQKLLSTFGYSPNDIMFLNVGRLDTNKNQILLLRFARKLQQQGIKNYKIVLVGEGEQKEYLQQERENNNLQQNVFVLGALENALVQQLITITDYAVMTSFSEGIPIFLLEALSQGKVVLSSAVGGIPELIQHRKNGMLFAVNDPEQLLNCFQEVQENTNLREELQTAAQKTIHDKFSAEQMSRKISEIFERI